MCGLSLPLRTPYLDGGDAIRIRRRANVLIGSSAVSAHADVRPSSGGLSAAVSVRPPVGRFQSADSATGGVVTSVHKPCLQRLGGWPPEYVMRLALRSLRGIPDMPRRQRSSRLAIGRSPSSTGIARHRGPARLRCRSRTTPLLGRPGTRRRRYRIHVSVLVRARRQSVPVRPPLR